MRKLHEKVAEHVDHLLVKHGDSTFYKNEIIKLVKDSLETDGGITEFEAGQVDLIVTESHIKADEAHAGKYFLKSSETGPLDEADKHLLDVFDKKLKAIKTNVNNLVCDFSSWQATFGE